MFESLEMPLAEPVTADEGYREPPPSARAILGILLLAVVISFAVFHFESHVGLDLNDEGFLWYGTIETARGEVPLRDFQSYEPGRYYWGAVFLRLLRDDGVVSLRFALAAFEVLGLAAGLAVARRIAPEFVLLGLLGVVLALFAQPRFRVFEFALPLAAILVGVRLQEKPSRARHIELGAFVGIAWFFGRNHGLYAVVAGSLLFVLALRGGEMGLRGRMEATLGGLLLGLVPLLAMAVFVPGFLAAFARVVASTLRAGTNLHRILLVPGINVAWPSGLSAPLPRHFALAATFIALPLFYAVGALRLLFLPRGSRAAVLASTTIVGSVYLHLVYSRPDPTHLMPEMPPFLLAALAFVPGGPVWVRRGLCLLVLLLELQLGANTALNQDPLYLHHAFPEAYESVKVLGDHLMVPKATADNIRLMRALKGTVIQDDEQILIFPDLPALYPILRKKAPLWNILYALPETAEWEGGLLRKLEAEKVEWALVCRPFLLDEAEGPPTPAFPLLYGHLGSWRLVPERVPKGCELRERPGPV